jgi:hypothetical protein
MCVSIDLIRIMSSVYVPVLDWVNRLSFSFVSKQARIVAVAILFPLIAGCVPIKSDKLKIAVTVEDNGAIYTGTGIQKFTCYISVPFIGDFFTGAGGPCKWEGEAVIVNMGKHGPLFLVMGNSYEFLIYEGSQYPVGNSVVPPKKWTIPIQAEVDMPPLRRFGNLTDMSTLESVDPNNFEATYGNGVKYRSITVEKIISGKVTKGEVIKILPWLTPLYVDRNRSFGSVEGKMTGTWQGTVRPSQFLGPQSRDNQ